MSGVWRGPEVEGVLLKWQTDRGYKVVEPDDHVLELWHRGRLVQVYSRAVDDWRVRGDVIEDFIEQVAQVLRRLADDGPVDFL